MSDLPPRFWAKVEKTDTCWNWMGALTTAGYGSFNRSNTHKSDTGYSHRIIYEAMVGPIPPKYHVDHLCRNRACCNPDHLEAVTHRQNMRRAMPMLCKRGHLFNTENTYVAPDGERQCRECARIRRRMRTVLEARSSPGT